MNTTPLSQQQIALVRETWSKILPLSDQTSALFYERLFKLNPALRSLFVHDMGSQRRKLMSAIGLAVNSLDCLPDMVPLLQELGRRHMQYGVQQRDYDTVAQALLWTLREGLAAHYTSEVDAAWTAVYARLAGIMREAAEQSG